MDNYTYYKDEIEKVIRSGGSIAICKETNEIRRCAGLSCCHCKFGSNGGCGENREKWLNAEHEEKQKPTISLREYWVLMNLNHDGYIARDSDWRLHLYSKKPVYDEPSKRWRLFMEGSVQELKDFLSDKMFNRVFLDFIENDDKEPWKIEDLLKLPIKDEE